MTAEQLPETAGQAPAIDPAQRRNPRRTAADDGRAERLMTALVRQRDDQVTGTGYGSDLPSYRPDVRSGHFAAEHGSDPAPSYPVPGQPGFAEIARATVPSGPATAARGPQEPPSYSAATRPASPALGTAPPGGRSTGPARGGAG
ncbi:hypothetical protein GCM10012279_31040 [Micromonospora yangpuensis]|nr:hypothetical protein GCM10012279_31040 [Micromonospora yangpuensis]